MGISEGLPQNTLANTNKARDWRIHGDFSQTMIRIARHPLPKVRPTKGRRTD